MVIANAVVKQFWSLFDSSINAHCGLQKGAKSLVRAVSGCNMMYHRMRAKLPTMDRFVPASVCVLTPRSWGFDGAVLSFLSGSGGGSDGC